MRGTQKLLQGDCLELLKELPDASVDLVLTDPPYNIGKADWDVIPNYTEWCICWLKECQRVLKSNGSLYFWHNDMEQIAPLMEAIKAQTDFRYRQFNIWVKERFRKFVWHNPSEKNTLRNWFSICEYCLYYVRQAPPKFDPLANWYAAEVARLGLTTKQLIARYVEATGRKPYMLNRYFRLNQFALPSAEIYQTVYETLGFSRSFESLKEEEKEILCAALPFHKLDPKHCNVWRSSVYTGCESTGRLHPCEKPVDLLERIIRVSCPEGGTVLDCFMGSGSTGEACVRTGRSFIGIEKSADYFKVAKERIEKAKATQGT